MSTKRPSTAAAAAICGETRCVRPPRPWRPSKLRLRRGGAALARAPACPRSCRGTSSSRPCATRSRRRGTSRAGPRPRPGGGPARSPGRPSRGRPGGPCGRRASTAAARRSPMRLFVQEPMKTRSSRDVGHRRAGLERHVGQRALLGLAGRRGHGAGDRDDLRGRRAPGDERARSRRSRSRSRCRRSRRRRCAARASRRRRPRSPPARPGGPRIHSNVVSSGAIMPARPPPSIVMLQIVIRPSIESRLDDRAGVLDGVAGHAARAELADREEDQVLGGDALAELARCR